MSNPTFKSATLNEALNNGEVSEQKLNFNDACRFYAKTTELPEAIESLLAWQAWDIGHSSGLHDVWYYYSDFADLVLKAFEAGKNSK